VPDRLMHVRSGRKRECSNIRLDQIRIDCRYVVEVAV